MVTIVKVGEKVGKYWVAEELEMGSFFTRYRAMLDDSSSGDFELRQYKSPTKMCDWYPGFVEHQIRVRKKVSGSPELQSVCEETTDIFTDASKTHTELFKATPPAPARLAEFLDAYELAGTDRLMLAKAIASALSTVHKSGLVLTGLSRWSIGVRESGAPVFLDMDWTRFSGESAPWDGHQGEVTYPGYEAPEIQGQGRSTTATDVFALGVLIVELLAEEDPQSPEGCEVSKESKSSIVLRSDLPDFNREKVTATLGACHSEDPAMRPTADQVFAALDGQSNATENPTFAVPIVPRWLRQSLQTLAFWVAYQNEVYRHHDLPEGAIVAELTRLIDASIDSDMVVLREPQYRLLLTASESGSDVFGAIRADLAVKRRFSSSAKPSVCEALVEVKRVNAGRKQIEQDIARLAQFRSMSSQSRAFLVVVSQASAPRKWISAKGTAMPDVQHMEVTLESGALMDVRYRVRTVKKAAASFKSIEKATYCCLIEVV